MIFNIWTFLFEVFNFLVLVYVLRRLLYRPLQDAITRRIEANAKAQSDAEKARDELSSLQHQLNERLAAIDREREGLVSKAREQAEAERKKVVADAEIAMTRRRREVEEELKRNRADAIESIQSELLQTALAFAERILREASGESLQQELIKRLIDDLQRIPEDERLHLRGEWDGDDKAIVEIAVDSEGKAIEGLRNALTALAGRPVSLSLQPRPELVGGLRLRLGGHVWDASLASVLNNHERLDP